MQSITRALLAGMAVGLCLAVVPPSLAADVTAGADLNSAYVWRGLTFNDGFVLQPSVDVTAPAGIGFNVWGNFDLDDYDGAVDDGEFSEVDLTVSYAIPVDGFDLGVGVTEYLFPGNDGSTREVFVEAAVGVAEGWTAGAFLTYDFDEVDDIYGNVSLAYGMDLDEKLSMEVAGLVGYAGSDFAAFYADGTDGGLFEYQVSLSAAYVLAADTELGAFLAFTDSIDDDALPDEAVDTDIYGGFSVYYQF
jgi:hypothetical protein